MTRNIYFFLSSSGHRDTTYGADGEKEQFLVFKKLQRIRDLAYKPQLDKSDETLLG